MGVATLGARLYSYVPPRAGFDLELLLVAGRRIAVGGTPYDAAMLDGQSPAVAELFYSYPPPVAQYLSLFAGVPSGVMLAAWGVAAALGLVAVAMALAEQTQGASSSGFGRTVRFVGLPVAAAAPFVFPFAIAILFGNLDALFLLLYGLMLLGALAETVRSRFAGGAALAIAAVAKLHPASMGLWFVVRGLRDRRRPARGTDEGRPVPARGGLALVPGGWLVALAAVAVGLAILAISLLTGGSGPWTDYAAVLRAGAGATLLDSRNTGPAAQVALLMGGDEGGARLLQIAVTLAAVAGTVAAAWRCSDTLESFAWATVASLVILPVTWFHYPVALLPVAIVAWTCGCEGQQQRVLMALISAMVIGVLAVPVPVLVWPAVGLVMLAVRASRSPTPVEPASPGPMASPASVRTGPGVNR